jgi:hypothetical protein
MSSLPIMRASSLLPPGRVTRGRPGSQQVSGRISHPASFAADATGEGESLSYLRPLPTTTIPAVQPFRVGLGPFDQVADHG